MLYPYKIAAQNTAMIHNKGIQEESPGILLLNLIYRTSLLFSSNPIVYHADNSNTLLVHYRDIACMCDDIMELSGESMAAISLRWPLSIYGTVFEGETGELKARQDASGEQISIVKSCASGRDFTILQGLCLRIETDSRETAYHLEEIIRQIDCLRTCSAISRRHEAFMEKNDICCLKDGTLYCYLVFEGREGAEDFLYALSPQQKEQLWNVFLVDGAQPKEFEWLYEDRKNGGNFRMLEWELTLQNMLDSLHFEIINNEKAFHVINGEGIQQTYDLIKGGPAEKIFLKFLFPLGRN